MKIIIKILEEIKLWIECFIMYIPGRLGIISRALYHSFSVKGLNKIKIDLGVIIKGRKNMTLGHNISIMRHSALYALKATLKIGNNLSVNTNTTICADFGSIYIGNDVLIGHNVVIRAADHAHSSLQIPIQKQGHTAGTIQIDDGVWIGANCVITRNVRIGKHSIVAAGSVVTHDVPPYSIVAGVPAKKIRSRRAQEAINAVAE